jgi:FKBP-type peptidyl-prolyl cis-trans isomerase
MPSKRMFLKVLLARLNTCRLNKLTPPSTESTVNWHRIPICGHWALCFSTTLHHGQDSFLGKRSEGTTQGQILENILNKKIPAAQIDSLPAPFNSIVKLCLVREASKRTQSAAELLQIIESTPEPTKERKKKAKPEVAETNQNHHSELPPTLQSTRPRDNSHTTIQKPNWAFWIVGSLIVLVGLTGLVWYFINEEEPIDDNSWTIQDNTDTIQNATGVQVLEGEKVAEESQPIKLRPLDRSKIGVKSISQLQTDNVLIKKYIDDNRLIAQPTGSGLYFAMSRLGLGKKPTLNDTVMVNQKGYLLDGTVIDSSYDRGKPDELPLKSLIPGWQEGLQIFREGSKGKLLIPSSLGYGAAGTNKIPPNSVLVYDIELLEVR